MKILVPVKKVVEPNSAAKIKIADGGAKLTAEGAEFTHNPFDDWAVEAALRLTENAATKERQGEIIVGVVGPADATKEIKDVLAKGAERAQLIIADDSNLDGFVVARALKTIADAESPDLILMGRQSTDGESGAVGAILAELLGWPLVTGAMTLKTDDGGKTFEVGSEADGGMRKAKVTSPAVITVTDRILASAAVKNGVTPDDFTYPESDSARYASLKDIMKAKKKPLEQKELSALGIDTSTTSSYGDFERPPGRSGSATFVESVEELVAKLKNDAKAL